MGAIINSAPGYGPYTLAIATLQQIQSHVVISAQSYSRAITLKIFDHPKIPDLTVITLDVDGFFDYEYEDLGKKLKAENLNSALVNTTLGSLFKLKKGFAVFPDAARSGLTTWKTYFKIQACVSEILNTHARIDPTAKDYLRNRIRAIENKSIKKKPEDEGLENLLYNLEKGHHVTHGAQSQTIQPKQPMPIETLDPPLPSTPVVPLPTARTSLLPVANALISPVQSFAPRLVLPIPSTLIPEPVSRPAPLPNAPAAPHGCGEKIRCLIIRIWNALVSVAAFAASFVNCRLPHAFACGPTPSIRRVAGRIRNDSIYASTRINAEVQRRKRR